MRDKHRTGQIFAGNKKYIINTYDIKCMESIYNITDI